MFCGAGSFKTLYEEAFSSLGTPRRRRRKRTSRNNPYASRGLDKFSIVASELELWKEKINTMTGSDDNVMVRFKHTENNDIVPVVIRLPEPKEEPTNTKESDKHHHRKKESPVQPKDEARVQAVKDGDREEKRKSEIFFRVSWNMTKLPCSYWPWSVVIVLVCLVLFDRVFAVCCTALWWYLVPTLNERRIYNYKRRVSRDERPGCKVRPTSQPGVHPSTNKVKPKGYASFNGCKL